MNEPDKPDFLRSRAFRECAAVFIIVGMLGFLCLLALPLSGARRKSKQINCVNNVKQVALGLRMFAAENDDLFPMRISTNSGGSLEWVGSTQVYRHFVSASNEIGDPRILVCPQDNSRISTSNFTVFTGQNLSYWIEQNAKETYPSTLLAGDRYLSKDGIPMSNGCYQIATQQVLSWNNSPHKRSGNVAMTDGSVQQTTSDNLRQIRARQQIATNWLAIP